MRVLLVGNRGIQHALAVRLEHEGCSVEVYPGQRVDSYRAVAADHVLGSEYGLVVMGSARYFEDPVIGELRARGTPYFGPDVESGRLETSKEHFKRFARAHGIETPESTSFSDFRQALAHVRDSPGPYVIKADGPARGCGVAISQSHVEAESDLYRKLVDRSSLYFAGRVVVERFVEGFEVAVNVFIDDDSYVVLPPTKPHKRRDGGDTGPNVAGMGSRAPVILNELFYDELRDEIIEPTLGGLREEGWRFRGCLFVNLMVTADGLLVLEFNCRMGDPAMLVDLLLLDSRLIDLLEATAENRVPSAVPAFRTGVAVAVTLADHNYPDGQCEATPISVSPAEWLGPGDDSGLVVVGAERADAPERLTVNSGVVATALAIAPDFAGARSEAYRLAGLLPDLHRRPDIGEAVDPPPKYSRPARPMPV